MTTPAVIDVTTLAATPNALASHYSRFRVADRLLLSGHSHQAWPDVALDGLVESFTDAAEHVDDKWGRAFAKAERVRDAYRQWLGDPGGGIAFSASTHDLVVRFLSTLDLRGRPRLVTTTGEFHTLRRQLARLGEEGVEVVRIPVAPVKTLTARVAEEVDDGTAAVFVSAVMFETARIVPGLSVLPPVCARFGCELLVDAYHALGVVPFDVTGEGLANAWVTGGGYKYLQFGEGNGFLRLPPHAEQTRPVITGWFSEFGRLSEHQDSGRVSYGAGGARFAGATYDPASNYRAAKVADFFDAQGLTAGLLREVSLHQVGFLAQRFDDLDLPDDLITRDRDTPPECFGGFLSLRSPHAGAARAELAGRGMMTDSRDEYLRLGPAPYLSDAQLESAIAVLGDVLEDMR